MKRPFTPKGKKAVDYSAKASCFNEKRPARAGREQFCLRLKMRIQA